MPRTYRFSKLAVFSGFMLAGLLPSAALAVPTCVTASLASYTDPNFNRAGGCDIGDFIFFRFTDPSPTTAGSPTVASPTDILVTPVTTATGAGFTFSAMVGGTNLFAISSPSGTTSVTYYINYSVDPAPIIGGSDLRIDPPFGDVSATQIYCASDTLSTGCSEGQESSQTVSNPSPLVSVISFPNNPFFVDINTDISLSATPGNPAGLDEVEADINTVPTAATPEPAAVLLTSAPLLLLFLARRKRS